MLIYSQGNPAQHLRAKPALDRDATVALVRRLFPNDEIERLKDCNLCATFPRGKHVVAGVFPGLTVLATSQIAIDYPSRIPDRLSAAMPGYDVYSHCAISGADGFAMSVRRDGNLRRALSISADSGVIEDIGEPLPFELPYWSGEHPDCDDEDGPQPSDTRLPFHPLDMGDAALEALFGFRYEGWTDALLDPATVGLMQFRRRPAGALSAATAVLRRLVRRHE